MVVKSRETTTLCDPEVMPMSGEALPLLIDMLENQSWTCNGAQVAFSLESLQSQRIIPPKVNEHGCAFG